MSDLFKKYLLSSVALFGPNDLPNGGGGDDQGGDDQGGTDTENIDVDLDTDDLGDDQDDDQDGDDQGDDGEGDDQGDDQGQQASGRQPSRGDRQIGELRRTARETARQNAELTRQLAEMRGELAGIRQSTQQPGETPQQRAERLALMSPEERIQEMVNEALATNQRNTQQLQATLVDQGDKNNFDAQCATNKILKRIAPQVERELQSLRQQGRTAPPRNVIAAYLIGQRVLEQQNSGGRRGERRGQEHRARPVRPGSDAGAGARPRRGGAPQSAEDYERDFGDVQI